jgi:hypothetical protein
VKVPQTEAVFLVSARIFAGGRLCTRRARHRGEGELDQTVMPSLFRLLMFLGLLGGLVYGAVFSLAHFVTPKPREITVVVPPDQFLKR